MHQAKQDVLILLANNWLNAEDHKSESTEYLNKINREISF